MTVLEFFQSKSEQKELMDLYVKKLNASMFEMLIATIQHTEYTAKLVEDLKFRITEVQKEMDKMKKPKCSHDGITMQLGDTYLNPFGDKAIVMNKRTVCGQCNEEIKVEK
jgi:hypothetical protein